MRIILTLTVTAITTTATAITITTTTPPSSPSPPPPPRSTLHTVFAWDDSHVWVGGDDGVILFFDGQKWTRQNIENPSDEGAEW